MTDQIQIEGQLTAGPQSACEGTGGFPGSTSVVPLALSGGCCGGKPYTNSTGPQLLQFNNTVTSVALNGVGAGGPVTKAHTVYIRTSAPILFTFAFDGVGPTSDVYVYGLFLLEVDPTHCITAVAAKGAATIEYLAVGNS